MSKKITDQIAWNGNNNAQLQDQTVTVYSNERNKKFCDSLQFGSQFFLSLKWPKINFRLIFFGHIGIKHSKR